MNRIPYPFHQQASQAARPVTTTDRTPVVINFGPRK